MIYSKATTAIEFVHRSYNPGPLMAHSAYIQRYTVLIITTLYRPWKYFAVMTGQPLKMVHT